MARVEIHAQIEIGAVAAEVRLLHQELLAVHGAGALVDMVGSGADPFKVGGYQPVDHGGNGPRRRILDGGGGGAQNRPRKLLRRTQVEEAVDVGQVAAIKLVEFLAVGGFVLRSVPPAPVAA